MKILLRSTNWVGDVAMSLPALKALRSSFPRAELTLLARPWVADLYRLRDDVDAVLVDERDTTIRELASRSFDTAVILPTSFSSAWTVFRAGIPERIGYRGELRRALLTRSVRRRPASEHQIWKHLRLVEAAGARIDTPPDSSWQVREDERRLARERLTGSGWRGEPFVAVHAASFAHAAKRWDLSSFAALFTRLSDERRLHVVLLGSAAESTVNRDLALAIRDGSAVHDLSGKSTLPEVLGILDQAALFVGNDSGLAHLAGAVGVPAVVLFGPTDPDATRPWDGPRGDGKPVRLRVVRERTACAPCRFDVCPIDHRCMTELGVERVLRAIAEVLA